MCCVPVLPRRDHGGVIFVDLRDREGIVQVVFNPEVQADAHREAHRIRSEFVLGAEGLVQERESKNPNLPTGDVEVKLQKLLIFNTAQTPPIPPSPTPRSSTYRPPTTSPLSRARSLPPAGRSLATVGSRTVSPVSGAWLTLPKPPGTSAHNLTGSAARRGEASGVRRAT